MEEKSNSDAHQWDNIVIAFRGGLTNRILNGLGLAEHAVVVGPEDASLRQEGDVTAMEAVKLARRVIDEGVYRRAQGIRGGYDYGFERPVIRVVLCPYMSPASAQVIALITSYATESGVEWARHGNEYFLPVSITIEYAEMGDSEIETTVVYANDALYG